MTVDNRSRSLSLLPALALALASVPACLSLAAPQSGPVAAIFPPWWGRAETMQAAATAGAIIRYGALPFIIIVSPEVDGAYQQLRRAGSWLLLDPAALGGCSSPSSS